MTKELYINGESMDIMDSVSFAMTYTSPFFFDFKNITQNKTSTITLPLTAKNKRIISNAENVNSKSDYPYRQFTAEYRENGVPIVTDATAHLLKISSKGIEITITWGYGYNLSTIKDVKINELLFSDFIPWTVNSTICKDSTPVDDYFYPYTLPGATDMSKAMPFVKEKFLIQKILERAGFTNINLPSGADDRLVRLAYRNKYRNTPTYTFRVGAYYGKYPFVQLKSRANEMVSTMTYDDDTSYFTAVFGDYYTFYTSYFPTYTLEFENGSTITATNGIGVNLPEGTRFRVFGTGVQIEDTDVALKIYPTNNNVYWGDSSAYKRRLLIAPNLPPVDCIVFIKDWLTFYAMYPIVSKDTITFFSLSDLTGGNVTDWSKQYKGTSEVSYTLTGYAQRNVLNYKEDKDVADDPSGVLVIDNKNIDAEKKLYESVYQEPKEQKLEDKGAKLFYLEMPDEEGASKAYENTTPYICTYKNVYPENVHYLGASFSEGDNITNGISYKRALTQYWGVFQKMIQKPKYVKCEFNFNVVDKMSFDVNRPVYIKNLGGYFLINQITITGDKSEVTLLIMSDVVMSDNLTVITYDDTAISYNDTVLGFSD